MSSATEILRVALFGSPPSASHQPDQAGVLEAFEMLDSSISVLSFGGVGVVKDTRAHLNADLAHGADTLALVYGDATDANNDFYIKVGGSGSGSWTLTSILHDAIENLAQPYIDELQLIADTLSTFARARIGETTVNTTAGTWGTLWTILPTASTVDGEFYSADIAVAVDQDVRFFVCKLEGDGTLTLIDDIVRQCVAGVNSDVPVNIPIAVGQYIGYQCSVGPYYTNPGAATVWYIAANAPLTSHTAKTVSGVVTVEFAGNLVGTDAANAQKSGALYDLVGGKFDVQTLGKTAAGTSQAWSAGLSIMFRTPVAVDGFITSFNVSVDAACTVEIFAATNNGNGTVTKTASQSMNVPAGVSNGVPCYVAISEGQLVGMRTSVAIDYTNPGANLMMYVAGAVGTNTAFATSSGVTVEFGFNLEGEYLAKINRAGQNSSLAQLDGLKWAALGTSVTAQQYYTLPLASLTGMVCTNLGVSGGSIGQSTNAHYGSLAIYNAIDGIPLDTEFVTIEAGINDFAVAAVPLGAMYDTTTATFYGALYAAVNKIINGAGAFAGVPNAKIMFMITHGADSRLPSYSNFTANSLGAKLAQFQKAVEDVAFATGWPVSDFGREGGIGYFKNFGKSDGFHLDTDGGLTKATYDARRAGELQANGFFS